MKQNILLNSFQDIYYHTLRFYVTTMWTSCTSNTRNGAVPAVCSLSGIKKLDFYWELLWRALQRAVTFGCCSHLCCHASSLHTLLHISKRFPSDPVHGRDSWQVFFKQKSLKTENALRWWVRAVWSHSRWWAGVMPPLTVRPEHVGNMGPLPKSTAGLTGDITSVFSVTQLLKPSPSWPSRHHASIQYDVPMTPCLGAEGAF